jgi:hypothetical protein
MPRERANERNCDNAIKQTLAYRSVFRYPLTFYQLATFLVANKPYKYDFFVKELNKMVKKEHIGYKDGKFYLRGTKPVSWDTRLKKSAEMYAEATKTLKLLEIIPWIKMVCITGSLAAYNADKSSDIDIFVVTEKNRLWLTRGFVGMLLKIIHAYVTVDGEPGKICPNLYVDESKLEWPNNKQNVYTAHEIVMMQPVLNRDNTYFKFFKTNGWIVRYFPNFKIEQSFTHAKNKNKENLVSKIEKFARVLQLKYMQKRKTVEITEPHFAHFRKHDNAERIIEEFSKTSKTFVNKEHFFGTKNPRL